MSRRPKLGISVDGSTLKNPGPSEYQGIDIETGLKIFEFNIGVATNNIAEFVAVVHGMSYCKTNNIENLNIYTDSQTAMAWIKSGVCGTKFKCSDKVRRYISRSEEFLAENPEYKTRIRKWVTKKWGECPADYGRK